MIKQTTPNNWFTGREVVELSGRLPSELFDLMKEDLQAYSQDGVDKIINRDKLKPRPKYSLDEILEQLRLEEGDHNTQKVLRPGAFLRPPTKKRTEKEEQIEAKMRFEAQKKDTYDIPDGCVAISFTLSPNKKKREEWH